MPRQGGPRFPPPQSEGQWTSGQSGPRFCPRAPGNSVNWRPGWRSSSGDRGGQSPVQQQCPPGQRQWSQGSADQQPMGTADTPPLRRRGCYICGNPGCHSDFHREGAVSPQAPPAMRCLCVASLGASHPGITWTTYTQCSKPAKESSSWTCHRDYEPAVKLPAGSPARRPGPAVPSSIPSLSQ